MDPCSFGGRLPIPNPGGGYERRSGCVESFIGNSKISNKNKNFANKCKKKSIYALFI